MSDILERLRDQHLAWAPLRLEAADEIERLRAQLVSDIKAEEEIDRLETDNERLREAGSNAFMAMCAFRDSSTIGKDEEVFQDAIDALGVALAGKEGE